MAVTGDQLKEIEGLLAGAAMAPFAELRRRFPALSLTHCEASDMTEEPFATFERYDLYLLDNGDHCVRLTADPACATGLILARRKKTP